MTYARVERRPRRDSPHNAQRTTHNAQRTTHNAQRSTLNAQRSTLNAQRSTLNAQRSTLNAQRSPSWRRSRSHCRRTAARSSVMDAQRPRATGAGWR
ncbi:MAG: hypothetical protein M0Q87_00740 [Ottowia sp.]|nr:hypothetical protein [Ottowia sp.]